LHFDCCPLVKLQLVPGFEELAADVEAVPAPRDTAFVRQYRALNDGPGFTTAKSVVVVREYRTNLACRALQDSWAEALRAAGRPFRIANCPHSGWPGSVLGIEITDRTEFLGVTLGDDGHCAKPFVYAFNRAH
jgi:hypothetical protein